MTYSTKFIIQSLLGSAIFRVPLHNHFASAVSRSKDWYLDTGRIPDNRIRRLAELNNASICNSISLLFIAFVKYLLM